MNARTVHPYTYTLVHIEDGSIQAVYTIQSTVQSLTFLNACIGIGVEVIQPNYRHVKLWKRKSPK